MSYVHQAPAVKVHLTLWVAIVVCFASLPIGQQEGGGAAVHKNQIQITGVTRFGEMSPLW